LTIAISIAITRSRINLSEIPPIFKRISGKSDSYREHPYRVILGEMASLLVEGSDEHDHPERAREHFLSGMIFNSNDFPD